MWQQTIVQKWISNDKYKSNAEKSGNRKAFVATIVANVVTERMWLDTTGLHFSLTFVFQSLKRIRT
jgi:hypothetical protein